MNSPIVVEKSLSPGPPSAPSSAASTEHSECSCNCTCENHKSPSSTPITPFNYPGSAPTSGLARIRIPVSPAISDMTTPTSAVRSPFSARSSRSPYDWDFKGRGKVFEGISKSTSTRTSVRHVREVVTRTVTYTPRMSPAPKGKKKKETVD